MYVIGMGAAIFTSETDIAQIMLKAGLGTAGLLIIVFSTVTTTFLDAYSAGISSESVSAKINGKRAAVGAAVIGTVAAALFRITDITDFLYLIGSIFAPMTAIQIADYFILKKEHGGSAVNVRNIVIWVIGFAVYRLLMTVDIICGNTLPDMVITVIICVVAELIFGKRKNK